MSSHRIYENKNAFSKSIWRGSSKCYTIYPITFVHDINLTWNSSLITHYISMLFHFLILQQTSNGGKPFLLLLNSFPMNILNIVCKGWFFYWCLNSFHMLICHQINTEFVTLLVFTSCTCHPKTSKNEYDISHIHSLCLISHMVVPRIKRFIQTEWMSFHLK